MKKISVIVPVYNVEKYLSECVDSLINQTYNNLEIILVDDGSKDNSGKLCDVFAKKDNRIKVIHKQNEGLGMARNTGLDNATGDYVLFVDSDDYLELDCIGECVDFSLKNNIDILFFGHNNVNNKQVTSIHIPLERKVYKDKEILDDFLPELISPSKDNGLSMSSCMALFSNKLIKESEWRFVSERNIISEDVYSILKLFKNVKIAGSYDKAFYNYRYNGNSLTHSFREDRFDKLLAFYSLCYEECINSFKSKNLANRFSLVYGSFLIGALNIIENLDIKSNKKIKLIKKHTDSKMIRNILKINCKINYNRNQKMIYILIIMRKYTLLHFLLLLNKIKNKIINIENGE